MVTISYKGRRIRLSKRMRETLEFATGFPTLWHNIGQDKASQSAIKRLEAEGLVEIASDSNQYRLTQ
jgi:hypothetical protein